MTRIVILPTDVQPIPRPLYTPSMSRFGTFITTLTPPEPSAPSVYDGFVGNLVLYLISWRNTTPITLNAAATSDWTQLYNLSETNGPVDGDIQSGLWARVMDGTESSKTYQWFSASSAAGYSSFRFTEHGVTNPATDLVVATNQANSNTVTYPAVNLPSAGGLVMRFSNFNSGGVGGTPGWPPAGHVNEQFTAANSLGFYNCSLLDQKAGLKAAAPFSLLTGPPGLPKSSITASVAIPK